MHVDFHDFGIFDRKQYCQGPKSKLLENSRPTACYFQWNSWKLWSLIFRYWCIFMLVSKLCDFWPQAVSSRFSNNQNHYFIDFWLGSWRLRGRKNVSVGHETSIPSIEKVSAVSFSSRGLFFSSIWTVRPSVARSDNCLISEKKSPLSEKEVGPWPFPLGHILVSGPTEHLFCMTWTVDLFKLWYSIKQVFSFLNDYDQICSYFLRRCLDR